MFRGMKAESGLSSSCFYIKEIFLSYLRCLSLVPCGPRVIFAENFVGCLGGSGLGLLGGLGGLIHAGDFQLGELLRRRKGASRGRGQTLLGQEVLVQTVAHHTLLAVIEHLLGLLLGLGVALHQLVQESLLVLLALELHGVRGAGSPTADLQQEDVDQGVTGTAETVDVCLGLVLGGEHTADLQGELAALLAAELGAHEAHEGVVLTGGGDVVGFHGVETGGEVILGGGHGGRGAGSAHFLYDETIFHQFLRMKCRYTLAR
ncbi:hypothetical protein ATCV1_z047R [Acanthocystis turfacea chlorella virus 1]|uniref:Uncharacterized protein z047R n=1 Tax=Chlorovirus heliozoae TaxID=322019 RepID=A7K807_9PHYC|nr:hypothetical protein ATCV1_z047R [Acanthocystis turfacea chlorella virus 1]ABT16181.1 hypothetical protein ATCV1_z047R [Acanthocystis turfacea chlorella virus 1]